MTSPCGVRVAVADDERAEDVRAVVLADTPWRSSVQRSSWSGSDSVARSMSTTGSSGSYSTRSARPPGAPARGAPRRRARPARRRSGRGRSRAPAGRGTRARTASPRHVRVRQDRVDARHRQRLREVDRDDARVRVRAPHGVAPEHPGGEEVGRVGELARRSSASRRRRVDEVADPADLQRPARIRRRGHRSRRRRPDRLEDLRVAGAAAEVARRAPRGSRPRSGRGRGGQVGCRHHEPGRAEAALDGARVDERLLHGMDLAAAPRAPRP